MFKKKDKETIPPKGYALLLTATDNMEAEIIQSKLSAYDIPVYKSYPEAGGYFTIVLGKTLMGIHIFVPEEKINEANEILNSAKDIKDEDILSDPSFNDESISKQNTETLNSFNKKALWTGIVLLLLIVIYAIYYLLTK